MCSRWAGSLMQVAAAELVNAGQLGRIGIRQVIPEQLDVRVDVAVDGRVTAAVVDHARRRDRQLRRLPGVGVVTQERERVGEDRLRQRDLADLHRGRRVVVLVAGRVTELDVQALALDLLDAAQRVDEVHVPRGAPQFPVGHGLQAGDALPLDHRRDRGVLG
jgi:hypothetical protein